jgi:hypothetical protein
MRCECCLNEFDLLDYNGWCQECNDRLDNHIEEID